MESNVVSNTVNQSSSNNNLNNCSPSNCKSKRDRGKNFLPIEREQLLQICSEFYDIIENKKTDSFSCKKKYEAWIEIAKKFNTIQTSGLRNDKHLKTLYDNIKRDAKRPKNGDKVQIYSPGGHYVGNATSLCNVLINESANSYEPVDNYESSPGIPNGISDHLTSSELNNERLSIKEEPSEAESETAQHLSSSFSSKDSYTSDCNYTTQLESILRRKDNSSNTPDACELPPSTPVQADNTEEYHKARLKYLEIEHKKKMEILDLEQECLMLKRDYLKAKLKAVAGKTDNSNETNNNV